MAEMIMDGIIALNQAKKYVAESLDGLGALKGANCVIESIDTVPEGNRVTFSWTGTDGTIETSTMIVENGIDGNDGTNGADGVGISKIEKIDTVGLEDTYRITFTNNTTYDYSVTNGQKGEQGIQGIRGEKGEQGEQGIQGIQGIKGEKGDDGYPFLIYKEYSDISEFNKNDFPEIGLMFMIVADGASSFPVYRYTGDDTVPYRYVTDLTGGEGIKGEKGDKGEQGEQGVQGENGKDGITYIPTIGTVTSGDIASATVVTKDETSTAEFSFVLPKGDNVTVDAILSNTSENPVQNKVIKEVIDNKADKTVATTETDGLMSAEDKGKLDAFEITTTGGKLHDKDIATTETLSGYLPLTGGMTTGTTGLANNFRAVAGSNTRLQFLINGVWQTCLTGDAANSGGLFGNAVWKSLKLSVDSPEHAYVNEYPIYNAGYKPFAAGSFGKSAEEATVDCGFAPTYALIFSCGGNPVIYSSESEEITLSETGFTVNASVAENTYSYVAFR